MSRPSENIPIDEVPRDVEILAGRCFAHVKNRLGVELDFRSETLSVLDFFVKDLLIEEGGGTVPPVGDHRRDEMLHLLAPTIGAYFGEVVRGMFPCRWRMVSEDPRDWLIEFDHVPLRFSPVGAAAEALVEQYLDGWDGALSTPREETESLAERLGAAPPVPEDEFFTLSTRLEVLQIAVEWLRIRLEAADSAPPGIFTSDDYDQLFGN